MKKIVIAVMALVATLVLFPSNAFGEELSSSEKINEYDFSMFEDFFEEVSEYLQEDTFSSFSKKLLSGEIDGNGIFRELLSLAFSEVKKTVPLVGILVALTLIYGVFGNGKSDFLSGELSAALRLAFSLSVAILMGIYVVVAFQEVSLSIEKMKSQMELSFPFLTTLLVASGSETTSVGIQPVLYFLSVTLTGVISKMVLPLAIFSFALSLFSNLSDKLDLSETVKLSGDIAKTTLVFSVVIFTAYIAITGSYAISRDGMAYKAARFALSQSVPIVGAYIKDGLDMAVVCSVEIKNAVGIAFLIVFIAKAITPIAKCFSLSFAVRLAASIASPFSERGSLKIFESVAKCTDIVGSSILCVTAMYLEAIFVFIKATEYIL